MKPASLASKGKKGTRQRSNHNRACGCSKRPQAPNHKEVIERKPNNLKLDK